MRGTALDMMESGWPDAKYGGISLETTFADLSKRWKLPPLKIKPRMVLQKTSPATPSNTAQTPPGTALMKMDDT